MKRTVWRRIDPVHCLNPCGKPNDCFGFVKSPRFQRNRQSFRIRAGRVGRSNGQRDTKRGGESPARQFYEAAVDDSPRSPRISEILPSSDIPLFATAALRPGAGAVRNPVLPPEPSRFLPRTPRSREESQVRTRGTTRYFGADRPYRSRVDRFAFEKFVLLKKRGVAGLH
jgi:hypothetical protein